MHSQLVVEMLKEVWGGYSDNRGRSTVDSILKLAEHCDVEKESRTVFDKIRAGSLVVTSDLHIGHKNIIKYCSRPFYSVDQMNSHILSQLSDVLSDGKELLVVGDVLMGSKSEGLALLEVLKEHRESLSLIAGNHDLNSQGACFIPKELFGTILPFAYEADLNKRKLTIISHFPFTPEKLHMLKYLGGFSEVLSIHGHTHDAVMKDSQRVKYLNVCWDLLKQPVGLTV